MGLPASPGDKCDTLPGEVWVGIGGPQMIRLRSLLALWGWLVVRTLLRRRWLQKLLLRNESKGWRVSPASRTAQADPVARCTAGVGRGLGAC